MWINYFRALAALSIFLCVSLSYAGKVAVIPLDDAMVVIPLPDAASLDPGVILFEPLTDGESSGEVRGGIFTDRGWKHISGEDKIIWDLGETMEAGIVEFELTGMSKNTRGGYLGQPGFERSYYFGLFNDPTGDKRIGGTNPAFMEIRYNWGANYANLSAVKFQAGDAGLCCNAHEPFGTKPYQSWNPEQYYKHKIVFGNGLTTLFIDDVFQAEIHYNNRPLRWRYLFVGDINYAGMSGPDNVTYRNVKVTKTQ